MRAQDIVERAASGEAGLGLVPEADLGLALLPAEVDLAAVPQGREVDQPAVEVAQDDVELAQLEHRLAQLEEALGDDLAGLAAAVARTGCVERGARLAVAEPVARRRIVSSSSSRAAAVRHARSSRVVALVPDRRRSRRRGGSLAHRRSRVAASASPTVRSWPWKASCQCSAGHLRACSSSPTRSAAGTKSPSSSTTQAPSRSARDKDRPCPACRARSSRGPRTARRSRGRSPPKACTPVTYRTIRSPGSICSARRRASLAPITRKPCSRVARKLSSDPVSTQVFATRTASPRSVVTLSGRMADEELHLIGPDEIAYRLDLTPRS